MIENPLVIVQFGNVISRELGVDSRQLPDAVYIPFLNRYDYLNELLLSLNWFEKEIIVLVSNENTTTRIDTTNNYQVSIVNCAKYAVTSKIKNLKTFSKTKFTNEIEHWDLPIKRNFALLNAREKGFNRVLLVDDDIDGLSEKIINKGAESLSTNNIAGCLVEGFPDTSVIGHIKQKYGEQYFPFLSGNFLFANPNKTDGFFPLIYNEDWLFMIPSINQRKIEIVDTIYQKEYDPFDNIGRIKLQEFGEIIAEGLFELINIRAFENRFDISFWNEYLKRRRSYVKDLLQVTDSKYVPFINESLKISGKITAYDCINFINNWENDIITFKKI